MAKVGTSLQKALLPKALLLLLLRSSGLYSQSVSLTLKSKHLREEASQQGINVPYPEFHEQSQIRAPFYQKPNFD